MIVFTIHTGIYDIINLFRSSDYISNFGANKK